MYKTDAVAILLATYQGEKYLRAQLDSLLAQTETGWKVFAHDDGSKDGTAAILREYAARDPERFCLIESAGTGGAKSNFLFLTGQVEASYYMYCDQDDVWLPEKVERTLRAMQDLEREQGADRPCLVHTELRVVDASLREICPSLSAYQGIEPQRLTLGRLLAQNTVTGCTMMINRALRDAMTTCAEPEAIRMHDWWAALIAMRFGALRFLPEATILYRQHGNNSVGAQRAKGLGGLLKKALDTRAIRGSIQATRVQAQAFAKAFDLPEDDLIAQYGRVRRLSKLRRLRFYRENGIEKTGTLRNLVFMIYG